MKKENYEIIARTQYGLPKYRKMEPFLPQESYLAWSIIAIIILAMLGLQIILPLPYKIGLLIALVIFL